MRKLLLALLIALSAGSLSAQQPATSVYSGIADPPNCKSPGRNIELRNDTGTLKICFNGAWLALGTGSGTVTSVSVVTANGFSGSVANSTTTPAITITCTLCLMSGGALGTPSSGNGANITGIPEGGLSLTNITTNNASTSKHGFVPILPNDATKYYDGTGAYSVPAGGASAPFLDDATSALVKGTADAAKLFGINVAGVTTANHPVLTIGGTTAAPTMGWLGTMSTAKFSGDERFGAGATVNGNDETATGAGASVTGNNGTANGRSASADANGTAVGAGASGLTGGTAVGKGAAANGGTAVGQSTSAPGFGAIALGLSALAGTAHTLVVGGSIASAGSIADAYFGSGKTDTSPTSLTFHTTGGSGTNNTGSDDIQQPGPGTGNAPGGSMRLQTCPPGTSGTSANPCVDRFVVKAAPISLTSGVAAVVDDIALGTLAMTGGKIIWTILCTDGTDMQSVSGEVVFTAINKGGVYTTDIETVSSATPSDAITPVIGWAKAVSAGTLTTAWSVVSGTSKVQVKVTSTTSLTPTKFLMYVTITNNSEQALN